MRNSIKKPLWLIVLYLLSASCVVESSKPDNEGLKKLNWFIGSWSGETNGSIFTESWEKVSDTLFTGHSYFIKGGDTLSKETISLLQKDTLIYYIPLVEGQNDNKPVYFKLTYSDRSHAIFENPWHDFPQKIAYELKSIDSLIATISGLQDDKTQSFIFSMKRQSKEIN